MKKKNKKKLVFNSTIGHVHKGLKLKNGYFKTYPHLKYMDGQNSNWGQSVVIVGNKKEEDPT